MSTRSRPVLLALATGLAAASGWGQPEGPTETRPSVGLWYTVWWTADDQFNHWSDCNQVPLIGRYGAGDPEVIAHHYAQFRELGIDFLIMDDTNGVGNDGGRINDNIRAWFDFMDALLPDEIIPICIGGGGEMRAEGPPGQARAADYYYENWACRPSYFQVAGRPLLLVDTDDNYGPGDFDDSRFTVRWVYNGDNYESMGERGTWGWGSYEPAPIVEESMSIWPGHRFARRVREAGTDALEEPREGGDLYVRMWLRALKAQPRFLTIADWNNFQEETALEDSVGWEDRWGYATPDLYTRITRAYSRLRAGGLVEGECYRDEEETQIYRCEGGRLVPQEAAPRRAAVIVMPAGMLAESAPVAR